MSGAARSISALARETTGVRAVPDDTLSTCLRDFTRAFPGAILSAYVEGSYADQTNVATSDLDLTLVFSAGSLQRHQASAEQLAATWTRRGTIEVDVVLLDEEEARRGVAPQLKLGSAPVWGVDLREAMPLLPIEEWTRDRMHSSFWRSATLFGRSGTVTLPMSPPEPGGEFSGYDVRAVRLADGREAPSTRDLIRLVGWAATALLALRAGVYVARKRDCHRLYREHIGDEWTSLIEDIYYRCRGGWGYLIPDGPIDRAALRAICARTVEFENHFLGIYRHYLLGELADPEATHLPKLLSLLGQVSYCDEAVLAALQALQQQGRPETSELATRALARAHR
jgi:hypothetical protein